jgi:DNA-binding transcriptional ArsR family regulator
VIDETFVDELAERVHIRWLASKRAAGVFSRRSEEGEELMMPYADLSEQAKNLDRDTVRAVLEALEEADGVPVRR